MRLEEALRAIRENKTAKLALRGNRIGEAGVKEVAEALKANTTLTMLNLRDNSIGDAGAKEVAEALKANTSRRSRGFSELHRRGRRQEGGGGAQGQHDAHDAESQQ